MVKLFVGDNEEAAVLAAVEEFQQDLLEVTGASVPIGSYSGYADHKGFVICTLGVGDEPLVRARYKIDTSCLKGKRESFMIRKSGDSVIIVGSDTLGTVFGVYHACQYFLGVDPIKFWTELPSASRSLDEVLHLAEGPIDFGPPAIRLRGSFVNEDDIIRQFDYGKRKWDCDTTSFEEGQKSVYVVTNPVVYEGLISTLLRLKQNLLLAGTYVYLSFAWFSGKTSDLIF